MKSQAELIAELRDSLLDLNEQIQTLQAQADGENRDLAEDEAKQIDALFAEFKHTEEEIDRRSRILAQTDRLRESMGRQTEAAPIQAPTNRVEDIQRIPSTPRGAMARPRESRIEIVDDRGKWGWRNMGEFAMGVHSAVRPGGQLDPRLIANAPTTFGSEGIGEDGGFAVPPEFRQAIMEKVMGETSLFGRTDNIPVSGNSLTFPLDETTPWQTSGGIQVYWMDESSRITQSKPALKEHTQRLNKLAALVPVTEELLSDGPSLDAYLRRKTPEKMDFAITDALVNGSGAGKPLGILNSGALITQPKYTAGSPDQSADTVVYENIIEMWSRMYGPCRANAVWLVHHEVEPQLYKMEFSFQDSNKFPVYLPAGGASDSPFARLMGRPVIQSQACQVLGDVGDIILADWSQYLTLSKAGGIRADVSIHLWFDYDVMAFRFIIRVTGRPWWTSAISPKSGTTTQSCFVALAARA